MLLEITLNERISGKFLTDGICNLSIGNFKRFIKTWIEPAADADYLKKEIEKELKENGWNIKDARKKLLSLSGVKSENTENKKAVAYIAKQENVIIHKTDNNYYLSDRYMMLKVSENEFQEIAKDNIIFTDCMEYMRRFKTDGCIYYKSRNDISENRNKNMMELFERIKQDALNGAEIDFSAGETHFKTDKYDTETITAGGVKLDNSKAKLFKNKKFYACSDIKPVYQNTGSAEVIICTIKNYC